MIPSKLFPDMYFHHTAFHWFQSASVAFWPVASLSQTGICVIALQHYFDYMCVSLVGAFWPMASCSQTDICIIQHYIDTALIVAVLSYVSCLWITGVHIHFQLKTLLHCCCRRKKFLFGLNKMIGPVMLLSLRENHAAMEVCP